MTPRNKSIKDSLFFADAYVSRDQYPSARVLEDHLMETNDFRVTKWCKRVLGDYVKYLKHLREAEFKVYSQKIFYGKLFLKEHLLRIEKYPHASPKVKSLVRNVMITKYKIDIIKGTIQ